MEDLQLFVPETIVNCKLHDSKQNLGFVALSIATNFSCEFASKFYTMSSIPTNDASSVVYQADTSWFCRLLTASELNLRRLNA
jgi:hypothetical protein